MNIKELATKYLVKILNGKLDANKISKIVSEIQKSHPDEFAAIIEEIRNRLIELESHKVHYQRMPLPFEVSSQANDDFLEYLALLNSAVDGGDKK